jgi:protein transport protein SEC23
MDDVRLLEEIDGLRNSWNVLPGIEVGVPVGALYTPCAKISSLQVVEDEPITCKICAGIFNHYSVIDYDSRAWKCLFCETKNVFSNNHVFTPKQPTIEYIQKRPLIPTFIYLIDTCLHPTDFASLKDSILQSFDLLPQNSIVGFVTYSSLVRFLLSPDDLGTCIRCQYRILLL